MKPVYLLLPLSAAALATTFEAHDQDNKLRKSFHPHPISATVAAHTDEGHDEHRKSFHPHSTVIPPDTTSDPAYASTVYVGENGGPVYFITVTAEANKRRKRFHPYTTPTHVAGHDEAQETCKSLHPEHTSTVLVSHATHAKSKDQTSFHPYPTSTRVASNVNGEDRKGSQSHHTSTTLPTVTPSVSADPTHTHNPHATSRPANTTKLGRELFQEMAKMFQELDWVRDFFNETSEVPLVLNSSSTNASKRTILGLIDEIAVHYRLEHFVRLTSELLHHKTVTGATNATIPAQRKLLLDAVTVLILHEKSVMLLWKMELLESVTEDDLRKLDVLILDPSFKASPAVKKIILKALLGLHKDMRRRADKRKEHDLIAVALGALLTRLKPNEGSKANTTLPAEEATKVDFILHSIYDDLISSVLNSHAEPTAKARVTAAVAAKLTTVVKELMEEHSLSEEAKRVLNMAALEAMVLEQLAQVLAQRNQTRTQN